MHTTSQKKKTTIPGIAYAPIVLARTMASGYPDPPDIFRHEKNQNLYLERTVPSAPLARHNHLPRGRPDTDPAPPSTRKPITTGRPNGGRTASVTVHACLTTALYSRVRKCLPEL